MVNSNTPLLNLYHNELNLIAKGQDSGGHPPILALRLIGGNQQAASSHTASNRDGYGVRVSLKAGPLSLMREHRCAEGYAAQNSSTMLIGLGSASQVDRLTVRWPSGKVQSTQKIPRGTLLTVYEHPQETGQGEAFQQSPYVVSSKRPWVPTAEPPQVVFHFESDPLQGQQSGKLRVLMTMATWCAACKSHLPQVSTLRQAFQPSEVELSGVPIDPADTPEKLANYVRDLQPAYRLLNNLSAQEQEKTQTFLKLHGTQGALPSTIITDSRGNVIKTLSGLPTVSDVAQALE